MFSLDNINWTPTIRPIQITNSTPEIPLVVHLPMNVTIDNTNKYFICNSDNIQFGETDYDGFGANVEVQVPDYPGLVLSTGNLINIKVFNINVN